MPISLKTVKDAAVAKGAVAPAALSLGSIKQAILDANGVYNQPTLSLAELQAAVSTLSGQVIPPGALDLGNGEIETSDGSRWVWFPKYYYKINPDGTGGMVVYTESEAAANGCTLHPAFVVNGVEIPGFYVAKYQASQPDATASSKGSLGANPTLTPGNNAHACRVRGGVVPWAEITFANAKVACENMNGVLGLTNKVHLMRNIEWGALALWCLIVKGPKFPRGNNDSGKDVDYPGEGNGTADPTQTGRTLTGTGPATWYHNGASTGIADLNGNVWEFVDGIEVDASGNFRIFDYAAASPAWQTISSGVTKGSNNRILTLAQNGILKGQAINATADTTGADVFGKDYNYIPTTGPNCFIRGGSYTSGTNAGVFALNNTSLTYAHTNIGFRPALHV
ncbi:hypothetical protein KDJ56_11210 [Brevibacillus composti]|uniref:Sulfatase-modifying factor enzyme domain-containing protein n=1 Tax=Brevibacillus composti TaxID=2796470 RepID=A0ABX7Z9P2_9BACL|nr:hypothetical protein [Brevibacillus composti]QUO43469.1 hypothetical protein KDJ56_11210 [Brevibacillus composti]